jgi:hypothetical protein
MRQRATSGRSRRPARHAIGCATNQKVSPGSARSPRATGAYAPKPDSVTCKALPHFPQFPHFPQSIRIHNQYTHPQIVPLMLLCIVTAAIKLSRPTRQDASLPRFFAPVFIELLCNRLSAFFSGLCALLVRSFTQEQKSSLLFSSACAPFARPFLQERKSTLLLSCVCARFCRTRGYAAAPKKSPCYHQVANAKITLWEKLCDCTHS